MVQLKIAETGLLEMGTTEAREKGRMRVGQSVRHKEKGARTRAPFQHNPIHPIPDEAGKRSPPREYQNHLPLYLQMKCHISDRGDDFAPFRN